MLGILHMRRHSWRRCTVETTMTLLVLILRLLLVVLILGLLIVGTGSIGLSGVSM